MDNTGGLGLICQVTIVNTITASGGSSKTTVRECHGAAGDPTASCHTTVWNMSRPVTTVNQCNDSINGGGGTLRCSVKVTNNFVGRSAGATAATVNQCVGSGDGVANQCDPFPASTTNATITQCNGSANGGTLVQLKCRATGTKPSSHGARTTGATLPTVAESRHLLDQHLEPSHHSSGGSRLVRFELRLDADGAADRRRGRLRLRSDQPDAVPLRRAWPPGRRLRGPTVVEGRHPLGTVTFRPAACRIGDGCRPFHVPTPAA